MELILFLIIVAVGGFWYINWQQQKKSEAALKETKNDEIAPYKVETQPATAVTESKTESVKEEVKQTVTVSEPQIIVEPVQEKTVTEKKTRKPRTPKAVKVEKVAKTTSKAKSTKTKKVVAKKARSKKA